MATSRKKKTIVPDEVINVYNDERLVSKHDKKQKANKPSGGWPKITQGTHLTVITYEDGRTELQWDDEQMLKEVREAIASVELANMKPTVRAKAAKRINKVKETK